MPRFLRVFGPVLALFAALVFTLPLLVEPISRVAAQRLRCQIYLVPGRIPRDLNESGLLRYARRHASRRIPESSEDDLMDRKFRAEAVFRFNRPVGDLEFQVLFYDIEQGERYIQPMAVMLNSRDERTIVHRLRLPRRRRQFRPNRRHRMVVNVRRQEACRLEFTTEGEEIRHSGQVDFTTEDGPAP